MQTGCSVFGDTLKYRLEESVFYRRYVNVRHSILKILL